MMDGNRSATISSPLTGEVRWGRTVLKCFARILEYPTSGLAETARECRALVLERDAEAARHLGAFAALTERNALERMQEIYTGAFELEATRHPYVGYHLFGETYKRSVFMVELKKRYKAQGFDCRGELPDHLAVMLRFLAANGDPPAAHEIIREALLPTLDRMTGETGTADPSNRDEECKPLGCGDSERSPRRGRDGYRHVLLALRQVLSRISDEATPCASSTSPHKEAS